MLSSFRLGGSRNSAVLSRWRTSRFIARSITLGSLEVGKQVSAARDFIGGRNEALAPPVHQPVDVRDEGLRLPRAAPVFSSSIFGVALARRHVRSASFARNLPFRVSNRWTLVSAIQPPPNPARFLSTHLPPKRDSFG